MIVILLRFIKNPKLIGFKLIAVKVVAESSSYQHLKKIVSIKSIMMICFSFILNIAVISLQ